MKQRGGYAYKFATTPPEYLFCLLCRLVARDLQLSVCCGTNFCRRCLETRAKEKSGCPACKETDIALTAFPNKLSDREIKKLVVLCHNEEAGCDWRDELDKLEDHLTTCELHYVECSQKCGATLKRQKLNDHLKNECPARPMICVHCYMTGEYHVIIGQHRNQCPKLPLCCPNECGATNITRSEMSEHLKRCPLQKTICKYSNVGCKATMARQDQDEHDAACMKEHFLLINKELVRTKEELADANLRVTRAEQITEKVRDELSLTKEELVTAKLKINKAEQSAENMQNEYESRLLRMQEEFYQWKNVSCSTICGILPSLDWKTKLMVSDMLLAHPNVVAPVIIRVTGISEMMMNNKTFQSPPFLTHCYGYRVSLLVIPNGMDQCKGSYLSIGICVLNGPNDGKLSWPLGGGFAITLLNQVKNNNHCFQMLDESSEKISKPAAYNAITGYVHKEFIIHKQLLTTSYIPFYTYCVKDTIFIQVQYLENKKK